MRPRRKEKLVTTGLWAQVSDLSEPGNPEAFAALEMASSLLVAMTGYLYPGVHQVTEMYNTRNTLGSGMERYAATWAGTPYPTINSGCECDTCGVLHRIRLRGQPIRHLFEVIVDGRKLLPTDYVLLDHSVIGFLTSSACCAGCVTVRYEYGAPPPPAGRYSAIKLANELLSSRDPDGDCTLPQRVTSVSRQGVSWTLLDPQDFLEDGRTGIYEVDLFLRTYNPSHALRPARVFSPDRPRAQTKLQEYPPLADVLFPDDLVVVPGVPAGWLIADAHAVQYLFDSSYTARLQLDGLDEEHILVTRLSDGRANLYLPSELTEKICYGQHWKLVAHNTRAPEDVLLLEGEARTL
jgi:hypothetical protein